MPGSADATPRSRAHASRKKTRSTAACGGGEHGATHRGRGRPAGWARGSRQGLPAAAVRPGTLCSSTENTLIFTNQVGRSRRVSVPKTLLLTSELAAAASCLSAWGRRCLPRPGCPRSVQEAHWNWGGNTRVYNCAPQGAAVGAGAGNGTLHALSRALSRDSDGTGLPRIIPHKPSRCCSWREVLVYVQHNHIVL